MTSRILLLLFAVACSSNDHPITDGGADADAGPLPIPAAPQVQNQGGPVLATPRIVPIFFANDAYQTKVEDFLAQLATSTYWTTATTEYGIGAPTVASSIVVTDAAPATVDTAGIETFLAAYDDGNASDVFAVFYPSTTTISDPQFGVSCSDFYGFHFQGVTNTTLVYAAVPRCASAGQLTGFDAVSGPLSHELIEAATDPFLTTQPAWGFTDLDHLVWSFVPGAEVADMCDLEPSSFAPLVGPYVVQRSWSNAAALAGHDPCVPAPADPYFNAAPVVTTPQQITFNEKVLTTQGMGLALGESKTIDVRLFSDAPTGAWNVQAVDTHNPAGLTFAWDSQTGNDGDTLHLTVTRTDASSSEFAIESTSGTTTHLWFELVAE